MKRYEWGGIKIAEWSVTAFPGLNAAEQYLKLEEELAEADEQEGQNFEKWIAETADVSVVAAILRYRFRSRIGRVIDEYIKSLPEAEQILTARDKKMEINLARKWVKNKGVYRHEETKADEQ
nr:MAG TPA: Protein of unknown function (DUF550) [Caudoviricetes sp.]